MPYNFENKMLELASNRREILKNAEQLLKQKRIDLKVERYYDINALEDPEIRSEALLALDEYGKQLLVEHEFYSEYHRSFVEEVLNLANNLAPSEKDRVLARSIPGLEENNFTRMVINENKISQNNKISRLIEIFDANNVHPSEKYISLEKDEDIAEAEKIFEDLDAISSALEQLSHKQREGEAEGKRFIQRFLNYLQKNA